MIRGEKSVAFTKWEGIKRQNHLPTLYSVTCSCRTTMLLRCMDQQHATLQTLMHRSIQKCKKKEHTGYLAHLNDGRAITRHLCKFGEDQRGEMRWVFEERSGGDEVSRGNEGSYAKCPSTELQCWFSVADTTTVRDGACSP